MEAWQDPKTITLWIIIIICFVFILVISVIAFVRILLKKTIEAEQTKANLKIEYQNELLISSLKVQERERSRIAADLHDDLTAKLTALRIMNQGTATPEQIDILLSKSIDTARRISHDLRPPLLDYSTISELIEELITPFSELITINLTNDIRTDDSIPRDIKLHLLRIFQEVISNIIKHAKASRVDIHFRQSNQWTVVEIGDNGRGFEAKSIKAGLGLQNIEIRMQHINGHYKIKSSPKRGTKFLFVIPNN